MINGMKRSLAAAVVILAVMLIATAVCRADTTAATSSEARVRSKLLKVKSVNYDPAKNVVKFKFNQSVTYKKTKVIVRYKFGKNLVTKISGKKSKVLTVKVKKLKYGRKYSYIIKGVRKSGSPVNITLMGTFRAVDK